MSTIASLGAWPDLLICAVVALTAYAFRRRPPEQVRYVTVWAIVAIQLWIALRSYATGDTFSVWMYVVFAVCIALLRKQIVAWLVSLQSRPRRVGQLWYAAVLAIAAASALMSLRSLSGDDIFTACLYLLLTASIVLFRKQIVALLLSLQQPKSKQ